MKQTWRVRFVRAKLYQKKLALSYPTGFAVGQFLAMLVLPQIYHDCAVSTVVRDWGFRLKKHEPWRGDECFCKGVQEGLQHGPPELQQDIPKQIGPEKTKHSGSFTNSEIEGSRVMELATDTIKPDMMPVISSIAVKQQTARPAISTTSESGHCLDAMLVDEDDEVQYTQEQQDNVFADLPLIYEREMMDLEDCVQPQSTRVQAYKAHSGYPGTQEIEMLMDIQASL